MTWKRGSGGAKLRVLDVATGTVTLLAEAGGSDQLEVIDFSPEGGRILFARTEGRIGVMRTCRLPGLVQPMKCGYLRR